MKCALAGCLLGLAVTGYAAEDIDTQKLLRKLKKIDPSRIPPATVLLEHHRHMGWVIQGKINDTVLYPTNVPLYDLTPTSHGLRTVGEIPVGTQVTLERVEGFKGRQFYQVKRKDGQPVPADGWVDGMFLAPTGEVSYNPDKPLDSTRQEKK